jgi:hypothetical protein
LQQSTTDSNSYEGCKNCQARSAIVHNDKDCRRRQRAQSATKGCKHRQRAQGTQQQRSATTRYFPQRSAKDQNASMAASQPTKPNSVGNTTQTRAPRRSTARTPRSACTTEVLQRLRSGRVRADTAPASHQSTWPLALGLMLDLRGLRRTVRRKYSNLRTDIKVRVVWHFCFSALLRRLRVGGKHDVVVWYVLSLWACGKQFQVHCPRLQTLRLRGRPRRRQSIPRRLKRFV